MPTFIPTFFSIVLVGRQNPQILNHDFLTKNNVLPVDTEPFISLLTNADEEKKPFTAFLSTPVVTTLSYDYISIIVEENRFQIKDDKFRIPSKSPIIFVIKKYFGELLRFTPFQVGGINFSGKLKFQDKKDEAYFDEGLGINTDNFKKLTDIQSDVKYSSRFDFPLGDDKIEIRIDKPKENIPISSINFNREFKYKDIDSFIGSFDKSDESYDFFIKILQKLKVETGQ